MVKIITYTENILSKNTAFSRKDKKIGIIYAEDELDSYLNDNWEIVSSTTSEVIAGGFGATTSISKLTVILRHY